MYPEADAKSFAGATAVDAPYLSRLGGIADELEHSADNIDSFIARCRGGSAGVSAIHPTTPVSTGHFAQIERVVEAMTRIDKLSRELGSDFGFSARIDRDFRFAPDHFVTSPCDLKPPLADRHLFHRLPLRQCVLQGDRLANLRIGLRYQKVTSIPAQRLWFLLH